MSLLIAIIIASYFLPLLFIYSFSIVQFHLALNYRKKKSYDHHVKTTDNELPFVTVQLPVYNERYVVERLIRAVAGFDYPDDKFEIQVLDDSTDETSGIIQRTIGSLDGRGPEIRHVRRNERTGFKAGALAKGTSEAKGELIAIFDADFIPPGDFLRNTVQEFSDPKTGMVQTRWGHLNREFSMLTRMQALGLDAHFTVEQSGRNASGSFINFNGTAGVWRKEAIEDAGGWKDDTLTEDLDLSYRAQLKGWQFRYIEEMESPAELPAEINGLRSQQFRWNKGAAQNVRKNLKKVLTSSLPVRNKIHAFFHLNNSAVFVCIIVALFSSIPILYLKSQIPNGNFIYSWASISLTGFFFLGYFYYLPFMKYFESKKWSKFRFILWFPLFLSISMGLALHNAIAVIQGWFGKRSEFIRTPKFNLKGRQGSWNNKKYFKPGFHLINAGEFLVFAYSLFGIIFGFQNGDTGLLPFHLMMSSGSFIIIFYSLKHSLYK